ncbi:binding-protein-dependent transport systems inner membrane component [Paenibacillus vortex V453]|uniref:Sugar ABC transporter permease n=2 Tax=Paenibacillus TaxID=44249 RepID=A0A163FKK3_9BACL|nr:MULTISPECIES: carbohydrate ABC transporter permease [Paenibacillus]AWP26187.1 sugar ABC transporter permease [Paenibacillus sp. Cedars]EFU39004.1 binding-protein-dependent transport systems inner membrane component [Paenibacillus vortex V453]KZS44442.1 sugar ABC transporter permease [Paenibacillus glucanolyticus]MDH6670362.1 raffinose/stachyose/melibiose transport system permease protein [Paenibacillus sp. LBL]MPY20613.1 carbohydrate ABC transporter permease [Paenibacillus glucanolyticus]
MQNSKTTQILSYGVVFLLLILYVVPLLLVFNISLKSFNEYLLNPIGIVQNIEWGNYTQAWSEGNFAGYFTNSLIYTVAATGLTIIVSLFAAFPVARGYVMWSGFIYMFFLLSQFLPNPMVAQYKLMLSFKESVSFFGYDTKLGYILLKTTGTGVVFMMFVGYIKSISRDLDEAAGMDGSGYIRYLFQIILPLMKPVIATGVILTAIGVWNDFVGPIMYLPSPANYPITFGLKEFRGQYGNNWPLLACGITIVAAPLIILYTFIQKYLVDGALAGAVKS